MLPENHFETGTVVANMEPSDISYIDTNTSPFTYFYANKNKDSICIVRPLPFVLFSSYVVIFLNVKLYHRPHESFFVFFSTVILFFFIFPPSFFTVMEMKPKFLSSFCFISSCFFFVKTILQLTAYKCRAQFFHYLICKLISVL